MRLVRGSPTHSQALRSFRCAGVPQYERDVESYIHRSIARDPSYVDTLLLLTPDGGIAALGVHEPTADPYGTGEIVTYIRAIAVGNHWQGQRTADGSRISHLILSAVINDALNSGRTPLIAAYVHPENIRSLRLLTRSPFNFHVEPNPVRSLDESGRTIEVLYAERRY